MKRWGQAVLSGSAAFAVIALSMARLQPAHADAGAFVFGEVLSVRGCPRIFTVAERNGLSIIQVVAGPQVQARDVLVGNLETIGAADAVDVSHSNAQIRVIIFDSLLSRTQYSAHIARYCNG